MGKDLYKILEIDKGVSDSEIKKAYRKLAKKYHPDKNPNNIEAENKFKDISEAYEILGNKESRNRYDSVGYEQYTSNPNDFNPNEMFENFFNSMRNQQNAQRKKVQNSILQTITLTMTEVYEGVTKKFKYYRFVKCQTCDGKGGDDITQCNSCKGEGIKHNVRQTGLGYVREVIQCDDCNGKGVEFKKPCKTCSGKTVTKKEEIIEVKIPHSVLPNQQLSLNNKGNFYYDGNNEGYGDMIIKVNVDETNYKFLNNNFDLISEIKIPYETLVLGGDSIFESIDGGKIKVAISELTKIGKTLKIRGKGLKKPNQNIVRGDQYLKVNLDFPKEVTEKEKNILKELKKLK